MGKGLTRDQIVTVALEAIEETGLDGLNMRALAKRLDVKAPAIYWHFTDKQDLLDEMATRMWREILGEVAARAGGVSEWREAMAIFAAILREQLLRRRDGAKLFSGTFLTDPSLIEALEEPLRHLMAGGGLTPDRAARIYGLIYSYTIGATIEEQAISQARERDDRYSPSRLEERIDAERFPLVSAVRRTWLEDPERRFREATDFLIESFDRSGDDAGLVTERDTDSLRRGDSTGIRKRRPRP